MATSAWSDVVHRPQGTKRHSLFQRDRVLDGPKVLKRLLVPQGCDLGLGTMTDIRNGTMEDLAVSAIRLAQQMPRIRFATTGDVRGVDIHSGYNYSIYIKCNQDIFQYKLNL